MFALIGQIQEETHRFAITYHKKLRSKRMRRSELDGIENIGEKRKKALMDHFHTIGRISQASYEELCKVVPKNSARSVYDYFHKKQEKLP